MNNSKKKILEKSLYLFLLKSYESVTMREIQEAAGISRGAIYHHFKSKEDIYEQIVNEYLLPAFSSYSFISEEDKKSLINTIYASLKFRQNHINNLKEITNSKITDFNFFKFIFQASEHCKSFYEQTNLLTEKEFNGWRNTIQNAMRTGEIKSDIDIDFAAQYFITSPLGLGNFSVLSKYIHINNDTRSVYTKFYNLLKKTNF